MTQTESLAGDLEAAAREELQQIVEELKRAQERLKAIHQRLPAPTDVETVQAADDEDDASTEIRSVIECVLVDSLGPAIRDLEAAPRYGGKNRIKDPR
jgi:hypothetical protein